MFPKFEKCTDYRARSARFLSKLGDLVKDVSAHSDDYLTMLEMYVRGSAALAEAGLDCTERSRHEVKKPLPMSRVQS